MTYHRLTLASALLAVTLAACGGGGGGPGPSGGGGGAPPFDSRSFEYNAADNSCVIGGPPAALGLPAFYTKYCSLFGFPIVSSNNVPDAALQRIWTEISEILANRHDVLTSILENGVLFAIMSENEVTTDIPEHADLNTAFPGTDWNARARGLGATDERPATSGAEENILCYVGDAYAGESIAIHEFAHTLHTMGLNKIDPGFDTTLENTYQASIATGNWSNTYAATDRFEYWAEGVQSYFNINLEAIPGDGIHNDINTRAELQNYDVALYQLIVDNLQTSYMPTLCPP